MGHIRDIDIRHALHTQILGHFHDDAATRIVDELGICRGEARVDVAVINGEIHGFEIKSEADDLRRLPRQIEIYGRVLDRATLIAHRSTAEDAAAMLPDWWGIITVSGNRRSVALEHVRAGSPNAGVDPRAAVELLWKPEALAVLESHGLGGGLRSKSRRVIWDAMAATIGSQVLLWHIRETIKKRTAWRSDQQPVPSGEMSRPDAR